MPRVARMVIPDEKAVYHFISRTALDGFPFKDVEKDEFVNILKRFIRIYFVEIIGFTVMGNHTLLLIQTNPDRYYSDDDIK